jgi:hypothetical protein
MSTIRNIFCAGVASLSMSACAANQQIASSSDTIDGAQMSERSGLGFNSAKGENSLAPQASAAHETSDQLRG